MIADGRHAVVRLIADVHVGNARQFAKPWQYGLNTRCHERLLALRAAAMDTVAQTSDIIVLGDLYDASSPSPQLIYQTSEHLGGYAKRVWCLAGNHDQRSEMEHDHALAPFSDGTFTVIDKVHLVNNHEFAFLMIPFRSEPVSSWLEKTIAGFLTKAGIKKEKIYLCGHFGIRDKDTPWFLADSPDAIDADELAVLCAKYGIGHVFVGNWHHKKEWEFFYDEATVNIVQVGALVPTGFDNPGHDYGGAVDLEPREGKYGLRYVPGPRFFTYHADQLGKNFDWDFGPYALRNTNYVKIKAAPAQFNDVRAFMELHRSEFAEYVIEPDKKAASAETRLAAQATRSETTIDEAVAAYVQKMPVAQGVSRAEVAARVRAYLKP